MESRHVLGNDKIFAEVNLIQKNAPGGITHVGSFVNELFLSEPYGLNEGRKKQERRDAWLLGAPEVQFGPGRFAVLMPRFSLDKGTSSEVQLLVYPFEVSRRIREQVLKPFTGALQRGSLTIERLWEIVDSWVTEGADQLASVFYQLAGIDRAIASSHWHFSPAAVVAMKIGRELGRKLIKEWQESWKDLDDLREEDEKALWSIAKNLLSVTGGTYIEALYEWIRWRIQFLAGNASDIKFTDIELGGNFAVNYYTGPSVVVKAIVTGQRVEFSSIGFPNPDILRLTAERYLGEMSDSTECPASKWLASLQWLLGEIKDVFGPGEAEWMVFPVIEDWEKRFIVEIVNKLVHIFIISQGSNKGDQKYDSFYALGPTKLAELANAMSRAGELPEYLAHLIPSNRPPDDLLVSLLTLFPPQITKVPKVFIRVNYNAEDYIIIDWGQEPQSVGDAEDDIWVFAITSDEIAHVPLSPSAQEGGGDAAGGGPESVTLFDRISVAVRNVRNALEEYKAHLSLLDNLDRFNMMEGLLKGAAKLGDPPAEERRGIGVDELIERWQQLKARVEGHRGEIIEFIKRQNTWPYPRPNEGKDVREILKEWLILASWGREIVAQQVARIFGNNSRGGSILSQQDIARLNEFGEDMFLLFAGIFEEVLDFLKEKAIELLRIE